MEELDSAAPCSLNMLIQQRLPASSTYQAFVKPGVNVGSLMRVISKM